MYSLEAPVAAIAEAEPNTASPTEKFATSAPTDSTTPAKSAPTTRSDPASGICLGSDWAISSQGVDRK